MREDLSTAIDDHMSGNNASGRSLIAQFWGKRKICKGIEIEPVDNKLKTALPTRCIAANSEILLPLVSIQP
jgi:hypothetical protein